MLLDVERRISAAQFLLRLSGRLAEDEGALTKLLHDVGTLLNGADGHRDVWRLRGIVAEESGDAASAIDLLQRATSEGDLGSMIRLERLLREAGRAEEADVKLTLMANACDDPEFLWAVVRDMSLLAEEGVHAHPMLEEGWDLEELLKRAAEGGNQMARTHLLLEALSRGEPKALKEMRRAAEQDPVAAYHLGRHLWPFPSVALGDSNSDEDEQEGRHLLQSAHQRGELLATLALWLGTDEPEDDEFRQVLDGYLIGEDYRTLACLELHHETFGYWLAQQVQVSVNADDSLTALRLGAWAAEFQAVEAVEGVGEFLAGEAVDGPWAIFGTFLAEWPGRLRHDRVGSPNFPLFAAEHLPALRDDHSAATPIEDSDFARRILEVLEQIDWKMRPLGDHLLAGSWRTDSGGISVFLEIRPGARGGETAHISTVLLAGLPDEVQAPWAHPLTEPQDHEANELAEELLDQAHQLERCRITRFADAYHSMQRRALEALFRLGENDSREQVLDGWGKFGLTLGEMLGRRATFATVPEALYPVAWASAGPADYFATPQIAVEPESHRFAEPSNVLYIGYALDDSLSGGHLKGVLVGCVQSMMAVQDYVTRMFDEDQGIFEEFFHAVPMLRILDHRDLLGSAIAITPGSKAKLNPETTKLRIASTTIADEHANPAEVNNASWLLLQAGRSDEAMEGFQRSARAGSPHSLATFIWQQLLRGNIADAVAAWEECSPKVPAYIEQADMEPELRNEMRAQLPNCRSNAGLAYLASGDEARALQLWASAAADGHIEARAYPGVLAWTQGNRAQAHLTLSGLSHDELQAFVADMQEAASEGSGWMLKWSRNALQAVTGFIPSS